MQAIVRDTRGLTVYNFEPSRAGLEELKRFYLNQYRAMFISGYQVKDSRGEVVAFGGSI